MECHRCDVVARLNAKGTIPKREQERKGAEVIALGEIGAHGAGHLPKPLPAVGQSLLVGEVVGVPLHRKAEPLGQHIIPCGGGGFRPVHILLIGLIGDGLSQIRVGLRPHIGVGHLLNRVQLVPPDGNMLLRRANALENVHQLHFDGIAGAVTNRALGTGRYNKVVVQLGGALLHRADDILPGVGGGQPLVHGGHFAAQALELVHRHGADLNQGARDKILNTLLGRGQLHPIGPGPGGVLQRPLSHELEDGASGPGDGGLDGVDDLLGLLHGGGRGDLMGGGAVHNTEVCLNAGIVKRLRRASPHDQVLLFGQPLLDPLGHIASASAVRIGYIDRAVVEIVPAEHLFPPKLEGIQEMQVGTVGQGQLVLAELDPALHRPVIIVVTGRLDQPVNPVHLHGNFLADRNIAADDRIAECAVVTGDGGVG